MIKHVGKHNGRKVVIVYRKVPGEDHMALVMYSDALPQLVHDDVMKVLESQTGQTAKELADAMFRHTMADGQNCLQAVHQRGLLKKVPTNQIIVTPNAKTVNDVNLDVLNSYIDKIEAGGEAADALANIDKNRGIKGSQVNEGREVGMPKNIPAPLKTTSGDMFGETATPVAGVLSDADIANMNLTQAQQMEAQAKGLLAEAKRLKAEAASLAPAKKAPAKKATPAKATTPAPVKAKNVRTTKTKKESA